MVRGSVNFASIFYVVYFNPSLSDVNSDQIQLFMGKFLNLTISQHIACVIFNSFLLLHTCMPLIKNI